MLKTYWDCSYVKCKRSITMWWLVENLLGLILWEWPHSQAAIMHGHSYSWIQHFYLVHQVRLPQSKWSKHMPNADSDMRTFLAYTDCSDAHPFEDLTQLVLFRLWKKKCISFPRGHTQFKWLGSPLFEKWEQGYRENSYTDQGKMKWAKACGLEEECRHLIDSFNDFSFMGRTRFKIVNYTLLTKTRCSTISFIVISNLVFVLTMLRKNIID